MLERWGRIMANFDHSKTRRLLLERRGLVFVVPANEAQEDVTMQALDVELADLGYALSMPLRLRLQSVPTAPLGELRDWLIKELADIQGSDQNHTPLFRRFPGGVPADTFNLWVDRVLVHFFQNPDQPCLFCGESGTTHVLNPCMHVVCSACFDGENYSGCPVCGQKIDASTPFLIPTKDRKPGKESASLKVLHLGKQVSAEARCLFEQLCARKQALSPDDRQALKTLLEEFGPQVLDWIPDTIPLRENIAQIFGALCDALELQVFEAAAKKHMTTATDVLRFIAAYSDADPSLQPEERFRSVEIKSAPDGLMAKFLKVLGRPLPAAQTAVLVTHKVKRFKVAKLSRPLRRALLGLLEEMGEDRLVEDMGRHASVWVWVGEFLHPHEYAGRFPAVASAFKVVRKKSPDGTKAPAPATFASRVEKAAIDEDITELTRLLASRPGEFGRRLDHLLRLAKPGEEREVVLLSLARIVPELATPMLLQLSAHFRTRHERLPVRVYFPAGASVTGVSASDRRAVFDADLTAHLVALFETELLNRFSKLKGPDIWILDADLSAHIVPFNERTASRSTVSLSRGSTSSVPNGKILRLFLHWCEPPNEDRTDLDLSVGFYGENWEYLDVCSYYELQVEDVARSSGDFTSAPFPDGATEFVDIHIQAALEKGFRYAVMVVNAYSGLPFAVLERAFAGLMLRDDDHGLHFDPRTVELKFGLQGAHGVFVPLVVDLKTNTMHWLDLYSEGKVQFNNVASSNVAIQRICPENIAYFASGTRPNLFDLGTLHAAARAQEVYVRSAEFIHRFERRSDESAAEFLARLRGHIGGEPCETIPNDPAIALLVRGDLPIPEGSEIFAIFRQNLAPTMKASDLF